MSAPAGWDGILDPSETILWQGRPDGAISFKPRSLMLSLFGCAFAGFALFWMIMAAQSGGGFWMFGLIHFSVGISLAIGGPLWDTFKRRHSWYTLTDRRAFVASNLPFMGKRLKSYPIETGTIVELSHDAVPSVYFATQTKRGKNGSYTVPVGFERIADAQEVYQLIRGIQQPGTTQKSE